MTHLEQLITAAPTQEERAILVRRRQDVLMRFDLTGPRYTDLGTQGAYYQKLCVKFHAGE